MLLIRVLITGGDREVSCNANVLLHRRFVSHLRVQRKYSTTHEEREITFIK